MPRRFIRKFLPDDASLRAHPWAAKFGHLLHEPNLWHLNRDSVAGAVAIGMFAGLVPGPFQMLTALLLAMLWRRNIPVAVLTTLYTNPFTIVPLYLLAYACGALLLGEPLGRPQVAPFEMDWSNITGSMQAMFDWMVGLGKPLALGLLALGLGLAALGWLVVQIAWRVRVRLAWRARRRRRERA